MTEGLTQNVKPSDDEYGPDVANGYSGYFAPHGSQPLGHSNPSLLESSVPLANAGAIPAGFSGPMDDIDVRGYQASSSRDYAAEDPFKDDEGPSAYAFTAPGASTGWTQPRRGRWQIFRDEYLTDVDWSLGLNQLLRRKSKFDGVPREITLNEPEENRLRGFEKNSVTTGKYGPITFLPKFLLCKFYLPVSDKFVITYEISRVLSFSQFVLSVHRYYSLWTQKRTHLTKLSACIQQVPNVSPTGHWTTIVPLGVVIIASAFKEIKEDFVSEVRSAHKLDLTSHRNAMPLIDLWITILPKC